MKPATRLYVPDDLAMDAVIQLSEPQAHQLRTVLRLESGSTVALFNGRDGEWRGSATIEKRRVLVTLVAEARVQANSADIWLVFAPIKHDRLNFLVEKATELGAARLLPAMTARTQSARVTVAKLCETAREAAEQCERLDVPAIDQPLPLAKILAGWPTGRRLFFCAEAGLSKPAISAFSEWTGPSALLTGPEGGFSPQEFDTLKSHQAIVPVSLGPLILRAETAAVAALACWQANRYSESVLSG